MVDIKNKKFGFSLAEALVSMLILSVFFVATSKIITTKPKQEVQSNKHGYFECYYDGEQLKQKRSDGSYAGEPVAVSSACYMTPPAGIDFVIIYALNNGRFYNCQEPQFSGDNGSDEVKITDSDLRHFQDYMEDAGDGDTDMNILANFFAMSYPSSSIYEKLRTSNNEYIGPAVFICW